MPIFPVVPNRIGMRGTHFPDRMGMGMPILPGRWAWGCLFYQEDGQPGCPIKGMSKMLWHRHSGLISFLPYHKIIFLHSCASHSLQPNNQIRLPSGRGLGTRLLETMHAWMQSIMWTNGTYNCSWFSVILLCWFIPPATLLYIIFLPHTGVMCKCRLFHCGCH